MTVNEHFISKYVAIGVRFHRRCFGSTTCIGILVPIHHHHQYNEFTKTWIERVHLHRTCRAVANSNYQRGNTRRYTETR